MLRKNIGTSWCLVCGTLIIPVIPFHIFSDLTNKYGKRYGYPNRDVGFMKILTYYFLFRLMVGV